MLSKIKNVLGKQKKNPPKKNNEFDPIISKTSQKIIRLGSNYGGWHFLDHQNLNGTTIVSFGVGEDISFDIEFINKYNAKVVLVDPTPRSINYYENVIGYLGRKKTKNYSDDGYQPFDAYDLYEINKNQLLLEDKAIWHETKSLPFFKPLNEKSVSHSIVNYKNNYNQNQDQPHILVDTITIENLMKKYNLSELPLIKMDIEGAETEVLLNILKKGFLPKQILVEFDGLQMKNELNYKIYSKLNNDICSYGYSCIFYEKPANLLYVRDEII